MLTILRHPREHARLDADPSLIPGAVEEVLRYDPTSQWDLRIARGDLEIGGRTIRAGQIVNLVLGAANRDPARFPDPDRFDPARSPNRHLAFGLGTHFCLGAHLARLELEVAIGTILRRLRAIAVVDREPEWKNNLRLRGPRSLRITFGVR